MRIGINGFGRIGRLVLRALWGRENIEITHINDPLGDAKGAAHLLEFDSVHGRWNKAISNDQNNLSIESQPISFSQESDFTKVPWKEKGIELILECSGKFKTPQTLNPYFDTLGMKRVVVACPVKGEIQGEDALNIVYGINHDLYEPNKHRLVTAASCTTNAIVPALKVVDDNFKILSGHIETVHAYTNDQNLIDNYHSADRRGRSAALNLVITDTGAAKAISGILPELKGKLTANAIRVPTPNVSLAILHLNVKKGVSVEDLNQCFRNAAFHSGLRTTIDYSNSLDAVSSDFYSNEFACVFDSQATISNFNNITIYCWYDNEYGYSRQVVRLLNKALGINLVRYPKQ